MQTLKLGSKGEDVKILQKCLNLYSDGVFGAMTLESVKKFQKENGLTPDGVVGNKTWEKLLGGVSAPSPKTLNEAPVSVKTSSLNSKTNKRRINKVILHCSATVEGKDYTTADIKKWHLARGFSDIGYHWVIYRDGSVHEGRNETISGAHCTGHNSNSIGICYIGGLASDGKTAKDTRTEKQKAALFAVVADVLKRYNLTINDVYCHNQFANKACPSFSINTFKNEYKARGFK